MSEYKANRAADLEDLYEEATRRALHDEEKSRSGQNVMDYSMYVDGKERL